MNLKFARAIRGHGGVDGAPRRSPRNRTTLQVWLTRALVAVLVAVVLYGLLAVPGRRYWKQRTEVAERRVQLSEISEQNSKMETRIKRLDDPDEIQRIARRDYGLVSPGEESYTILPAATAGLNLPASWPFDRLSEPVRKIASGPN